MRDYWESSTKTIGGRSSDALLEGSTVEGLTKDSLMEVVDGYGGINSHFKG